MTSVNLKEKTAVFAFAIIMIFIPQAVFADSSWIWLTDNRPFDILPPVAAATIVIETLAIWLIPHTGHFLKTAGIVILANAASFLLPYAILLTDQVHPGLQNVLNSGPYYIVSAFFLSLTIGLEFPIIYNSLKKHVDNKKKLLCTIIGANIVTTVMVAVIERIVTDGYYV
ncbi:MAG: hypothetical protein MJ161_05585 [Clostridia bacterium]|nr:hypothetical protein [Clostridia bacterium]